MCRQTEKEVGHRVGLPRHRHFVGFVNVLAKAPTWRHPFYGYSETLAYISCLLRHAWGY